jgi:HEAT repeat protein
LANVETENVRSLVLLLGWIDSPAAARALTRCLGSSELRNEIVSALVNQGSNVTDLLLDQLPSEDLEVRSAAVKALGRIRDRRASLPLIELLGKDEESTIPLIGALAAIGDPTAVDPIFRFLRSPDPAVRQAAVTALNSLASPEIVERVIPLLEDAWPGVRESALRILGHFSRPENVNALLARCYDENESVRCAALEQLRFVDDRRVPKILGEALRQEGSVVRAAAAAAMVHVARQEAIPYLTEALADDDPWVRYFSARSLDMHRAVETASDLYRLASSDKFHQVRIAAFEALSRMDEKLAASVAGSFLTSTDEDLRQVASNFLALRNGTV